MDAAACAGLFDLGRVLHLSDGPVARGREGVVWRLDTSDGRWAVKVPLTSVTEADVRPGAQFQQAAFAAGVPAPAVRPTHDGDVLGHLPTGPVRVFSWVDLAPPDPGLDPEAVGAVLAAIHRVEVADVDPEDPWFHDPIGAARWDAVVSRLTAEGAPFAARLADLRDELVALESWIEPADSLRACHRDLWADNLRGTVDGGICVIDWESTGLADPSHELACVMFEFARDDAGRLRALRDAYRSGGGPGDVSRRGHFTMLIAQLGHITELGSYDWLVPNDRTPSREDADAWVSEVLDDPHTRARLDRILAALTN
jgi:Ser/Thr protein kinase RdoA (MazF antagonist)